VCVSGWLHRLDHRYVDSYQDWTTSDTRYLTHQHRIAIFTLVLAGTPRVSRKLDAVLLKEASTKPAMVGTRMTAHARSPGWGFTCTESGGIIESRLDHGSRVGSWAGTPVRDDVCVSGISGCLRLHATR